MGAGFKEQVEFLRGLGIEQVGDTGKSYLAHLVALYRLLEAQGCTEEVCRAGLFHSIYGTERFQGFTLPLERRPEVRALAGVRAERLAYLNCAVDRSSLDRALERDAEPYPITDRTTGEEVPLARQDFDDRCRVQLFDWLEQAPRDLALIESAPASANLAPGYSGSKRSW
jgi:hypothetical protein